MFGRGGLCPVPVHDFSSEGLGRKQGTHARRSDVQNSRYSDRTPVTAIDRGAARLSAERAVRPEAPASLDLSSQLQASKGEEDALFRTLSSKSRDTVTKLSEYRRSFDDIEASVEQLIGSIHTSEAPPGRARNELAQLEAMLDKLQCKGVDSVDTFELSSGKELAKSIRKELTGRAEKIHDRIDEGFKAIKCAEQRAQL